MIDLIVVFLIMVMLITLGVALFSVLVDLYDALRNLRHEIAIQTLVESILSVFVLIELFRSFTDYLEFHRLRLRVISEVAIVFVLRDVFIGLYSHSLEWRDILALSLLIAVLVGTRVASLFFPPPQE
ncbi:phosphate-starvation-inducible PsiE family protein [Ferrovum myxofaciens]|nr:phosphate-starvation-inducible PsiE family protein [Ferrovum myxofaciens]QWY74791.1 MAG: phosphate-starvation-inducible PsiE family protein [Ferrovum myxofaciens]